MAHTTRSTNDEQGGRWWREPIMWLVVGAPLAAVIGGFAILWIAIRVPDPVMATDYQRGGAAVSGAGDKSTLPALVGRNHAVTPGHDVPAKVR
ncbi:MAG: nitrogen fixation protein FixH [Burkholderiaceae bacterium]